MLLNRFHLWVPGTSRQSSLGLSSFAACDQRLHLRDLAFETKDTMRPIVFYGPRRNQRRTQRLWLWSGNAQDIRTLASATTNLIPALIARMSRLRWPLGLLVDVMVEILRKQNRTGGRSKSFTGGLLVLKKISGTKGVQDGAEVIVLSENVRILYS